MEKFNKIEGDKQFNINFDNKNEKKKAWRELVGEDTFREKMLKFKIGPGLWNTVVIDESGKVLQVDGCFFAEWKAKNRKIDRPTKSGDNWYNR